MSADLTRIAVALERIAAVLEFAVLAEDAPPEPEPCAHPDEQRIAFGLTDGRPDWQCKVCGYRSVEQPHE